MLLDTRSGPKAHFPCLRFSMDGVGAVMTVYLMHGVVHHWSQSALVHRNYVPLAAFELHLRQRKTPYVRWSAGWPSEDVLTVDDATRGGAEACSIARQLGHEVIFFVNPLQVSTG